MVTSTLPPLLLLLTTLLLSPFPATTQPLPENPVISKACNQTYYPDDCLKAFEPYLPKTLDLPEVARISIGISSSKAKEGYPVVYNWIGKAPDYPTWGNYQTCASIYNQSITDINGALDYFDGKKYDKAFTAVEYVYSNITYCNSFNMAPIAGINSGMIRLTNNTATIVKLLF